MLSLCLIKIIMKLLRKNIFQLFIQTQKTPNPNFLKFVPTAKVVMGASDPVDIPSPEDAYRLSPLARKIFKVTGVTRIFYGKDYISIAKSEETNWN